MISVLYFQEIEETKDMEVDKKEAEAAKSEPEERDKPSAPSEERMDVSPSGATSDPAAKDASKEDPKEDHRETSNEDGKSPSASKPPMLRLVNPESLMERPSREAAAAACSQRWRGASGAGADSVMSVGFSSSAISSIRSWAWIAGS